MSASASRGLARPATARSLGWHRSPRLRSFLSTTSNTVTFTEQREQSPVPPTVPAASGPALRRERLRTARPFSDFLTDNFNRQHDYLRISLTERCNLRCVYCMPEDGVPLSPPRELLTTPEIVMLSSVFVSQGVSKIRLTGGEPTVRPDILPLMNQIGALRPRGLRELCLTTNGIALHRKLESMVEAGLTGVNLSLDTLDPWQFQIMTRRKGFDAVMKSIDRVHELNKHGAGIRLKINCVVMRGVNDREILPFVEMTRESNVEVRFIEYMPFGGNNWNKGKMFSYNEMLELIRAEHPTLQKVVDHKNDTSKTWEIPGFQGRIGFITSMTHNFCGTCNRLRITNDGNLKVCLFGNAEVSLRDILRQSNGGEPINETVYEAMKASERERAQGLPGQPLLNKLAASEAQLLETIGLAVKRKKEKHAGMGELEHMKNRPMILIDPLTKSPSWSWLPRTRKQIRSEDDPRKTVSPTWTPATTYWRYPYLLVPDNRKLGFSGSIRLFSTTYPQQQQKASDKLEQSQPPSSPAAKLTHVSASGAAHMVSIEDKKPTKRVAKARCRVVFTNEAPVRLIRDNQNKKGDVLGVARVAGIMASKRTSDLIPLCHPISITKVAVELSVNDPKVEGPARSHGSIDVEAMVGCDGKTGVEMEALTSASVAALTVYDMCKAVDKGMRIEGLRVVLKEGGKSGIWVEEES